MNKTTKGALAAGAAAVLLMGGAGTLAFWSDSGTVEGGSIASGELSMTDPTCDTAWTPNIALLVPGDEVTKECTFTITAAGDNLQATLDMPDTVTVDVTSTPEPTTLDLPVSVAYEVGGVALDPTITAANDGDVVTATITVSFPFGDATTVNANDTQNLAATLDTVTITLQQDDA